MPNGATLSSTTARSPTTARALSGGGIYNQGTLTAVRSTIAAQHGRRHGVDGGGGLCQRRHRHDRRQHAERQHVRSTASGGAINTRGPLTLCRARRSPATPPARAAASRFGSASERPQHDPRREPLGGLRRHARADLDVAQPRPGRAPAHDDRRAATSSQHARLEALDDYGGQTETQPPGAPAAARSTRATTSACGGTLIGRLDQRGQPRVQGAHCDIGAVETATRRRRPPPPVITLAADGDRLATGRSTSAAPAARGSVSSCPATQLDDAPSR